MIFLTTQDLPRYFNETHILQTILSNQKALDETEFLAVEMVKAAISTNYDEVKAFIPIQSFSNATTYQLNDRVYFNQKHYVYINETASSGNALTDGAYWEQNDNRNKILVNHVLRILRYHIAQPLELQNIPPFWIDDYKYCTKELQMIQKGDIIIYGLDKEVDETGNSTESSIFYITEKESKLSL